MLADVQSSYGLARPFQGVGNFETEHQRNLVREVCAAVQTGRLIVVSGLVGSGKTHLLRRIEDELARAGKVAVAKSLAVDKRRTSLPRSEEHTSELQSLMRISYAVFCLKKKKKITITFNTCLQHHPVHQPLYNQNNALTSTTQQHASLLAELLT